MSEIRTSCFCAVLIWLLMLGCPEHRAVAASRTAELVTDRPTPYCRTLAVDSRGRLWASFMNEQGLETWGIGCPGTASPTLIPAAALSARRVFALRAVADGAMAVATDDGLRIITPDGRIETAAKKNCMLLLAQGAGDALLAAGTGEDGALILVRRRDAQPLEQWRLSSKGRGVFRDPLNMFELPDGRVMIVLATDIVMLEGGKLRRLAWEKSPLATPDCGRSAERRAPPIWLYDAAKAPDGSVYFIGYSKKLVRWRAGRFETLAEGHFQDLAIEADSGIVWVTDFDGALLKWGGKALEPVYRLPDGDIHTIWPMASGAIWLECAPASGPHRLVRVPADAAGPDDVSLEFHPGLLSPGILSLLEAADGTVHVATNEGLWRIPEPGRDRDFPPSLR